MEKSFLARHEQLEQKLDQWVSKAGKNMKVEYEVSYSKDNVYAITLTDFSVKREAKTAVYIAQPHAHEPATTAGMIDVIEQLVSGKDLAGNPTKLDVENVLAQTIVTFNPIGNPYGNKRAPYLYWDGSKVTNNQFWCFMRGEDPESPGKMWGRYDLFDTREVKAPDPIGIVYEPIDDYRFVEPNRSQLSTYFKLFNRMNANYRYQYFLSLHQTEYPNSPTQCMVFLPLEDLPAEHLKQENADWAQMVSDAWQEAGFIVAPPKASAYTGIQAEYLRQNWRAIDQSMNRITIEVKNNAADTPADRQMAAEALSITATLQRLVSK